MGLKDRITDDMKDAMRAKDSARLLTIRGLLAALKQREVDERIELDDAAVLSVIDKMIKQRRESIAQFEKASRADLADAEKAEVQVLSAYLPAQMGEKEISEAVVAAIAESGATGVKDMGKVMALLRERHGNDLFLDSSNLTLISGPSRTGDIELTLTLGVHGPREIHVVLID